MCCSSFCLARPSNLGMSGLPPPLQLLLPAHASVSHLSFIRARKIRVCLWTRGRASIPAGGGRRSNSLSCTSALASTVWPFGPRNPLALESPTRTLSALATGLRSDSHGLRKAAFRIRLRAPPPPKVGRFPSPLITVTVTLPLASRSPPPPSIAPSIVVIATRCHPICPFLDFFPPFIPARAARFARRNKHQQH